MEQVLASELVEDNFEARFAPEEDVYVQIVVEEDGVWLPRDGAGFPGIVTPGRALDSDLRTRTGIQVLPYYALPRGDRFASGAPWSVTDAEFRNVLSSGEKVHWRFAVRRATSEEVEVAKQEAIRDRDTK